MVRRSTPQARTDDHAFPVRVKIAVPVGGLGNVLIDMQNWLRDHLGTGEYAIHSAPTTVGDAAAFHFRAIESGQRFVDAFPTAELADGTVLDCYSSPYRR
jgi:hypothetical protein